MNTLIKPFTLLLLLLLVGCSDTHKLVRYEGSGSAISQDAAVYIALPRDGQYGSIVYTGSGKTVALEVDKAFQGYVRETTIATKRETLKNALESAKAQASDYLIYPEIVHWEDRNTGWSGRPDVATIKLSIVDVLSGMVLDSAELGGTSKVMSWSLEHPEDLIPKPLAEYAASLFK